MRMHASSVVSDLAMAALAALGPVASLEPAAAVRARELGEITGAAVCTATAPKLVTLWQIRERRACTNGGSIPFVS